MQPVGEDDTMGRIGVCVALGLVLAGIAGADDPEVARLKARVEQLEAENKSLREALKGDADARAELTRLALDIRMLHRLQAAMIEKPNDYVLKTDAADLAKRIAPHSKGNRTVWQVLLDTKVLEDGMTVERAEKLLGPATEKSPERLGWYFNPNHQRHVAPYLGARITEKGLVGWKLISH
jgi:hypothetical protein